MRPVFYTNGSTRLEVGDDPFIITGSAAKFSDGDTAVLHCPVFAYPQADIEWYKDGESIGRLFLLFSSYKISFRFRFWSFRTEK